jgi:hypothetical protein
MRAARIRVIAMALLALAANPSFARAANGASGAAPSVSYADLADLADSASMVIRANVRSATRLKPSPAAPALPGQARFLVKARTVSLLSGDSLVGEDLSYLAYVPTDSRGKPQRLKKAPVLLFARPVPQRPGELQLIAPDAQVAWTPEVDTMLRGILGELVAPGAPPAIIGVREALHVPGALRGEGETQIFLATRGGSAASLSILHVPGQAPTWGVSFSEVTAETGRPPARDTLAWYRLACFLPHALPAGANRSGTAAARAQAEADYRMVLGELGECPRLRG